MNRARLRSAARWTAALLCASLSLSAVWAPGPVKSAADFEGKGTEDEPYLIQSKEDLIRLSQVHQKYRFKHFRQTGDIDLSGVNWTPIGTPGTPFEASYDGYDHKITGLTIDDSSGDPLGLFGSIGEYGVVAHVHVAEGSVKGPRLIGGIAGENRGIILNSTSDVFLDGILQVGGLVGENYGVISHSSASARVKGQSHVGGLVGSNYGLVQMSHVSGANSVTCATYGTGCDVENTFFSAGGLVGTNQSSGRILNSSSSASVGGEDRLGGLVGRNEGEIIRSSAVGHVYALSSTANSHTGGLVGQNDGGAIHFSHARGIVKGFDNTGGLVGTNDGGEIKWSRADGSVTGQDQTGGLVGANRSGGLVHASYAEGNVTARNYVGGLVGYNDGGRVVRSYSTGDVQTTNEVSSASAGGLIGDNRNGGTVEDSYTWSRVVFAGYAGGLAGWWSSNSGSIERAYAYGTLPANGKGVFGLDLQPSVAKGGVFWNTEIAATSDSGTTAGGVTGLASAQMKDRSIFEGQGWDFDTVWEMRDGAPGPTLRPDRSWLETFIREAEDLLDDVLGSSGIGTQPGQYPQDAADALAAAIQWAIQAADQAAAHYEDPSDVYDVLLEIRDQLEQEKDRFLQSVIPYEIPLIWAETFLGDKQLNLAFDPNLQGMEEVRLDPYRIHLSDPNVWIIDWLYHSPSGTLALWLAGSFASDQPEIAMFPGFLTLEGVPNRAAGTIRVISQAVKEKLREDLLGDSGDDSVTVRHVLDYLSGSDADLNGDGTVNQVDILYLMGKIDPVAASPSN